MAVYYRRDDDVQNGLGEAMPNIAVTYYAQGGALATVYADSSGSTPASNPQYTNGLGQTVAYLAAGTYTITYSGDQIQTLTYADQIVGGGGGSGSTVQRLVPSPVADGTTRIFTLSVTPSNPANDQLFVAGSLVVYGIAYTISGSTITWIGAVPPQEGDTMEYWIL